MSIVHASGPKITIKTADAFYLGDANDTWAGTLCVHLVSGTFVGSISVKGMSRTKEAADDAVTPVAINYVKVYLNGSVADQTYVNTAITDTSLILIPATGQQIVLDCTSFTSGTMTAYVSRVSGAAA